MMKRLFAWLNTFFPKLQQNDEEINKIYNTTKDVPDTRDHLHRELCSSSKHRIHNLPPIRSQGSVGSCASHAAISCYEIQLSTGKFLEGSELFHYYNARKFVNKTYPKLGGMTMRDACKTLKEWGFSFEYIWPYQVSKCNEVPTRVAYWFSKLYKVKEYERMYNIESIKSSIIFNNPVMCGIFVNRTFMNLNKDNHLYNPANISDSGHAVVIIGFDDAKQEFIMRNSWGTNWGDDGYFRMTYKSFKKCSFDWWRILI